MLRIVTALVGLWCCHGYGLAAEAPPPPVASAAPTPAAGEVVRLAFTSAVVDREPVDNILTLGSGESHVYCFTELRGFAGQRLTHRWEYEGRVMAEVSFEVGGWRWRVWSRKNLRPEWRGRWRVSVVDEAGRVVAQQELAYDAARAFAPPQPTRTAARP